MKPVSLPAERKAVLFSVGGVRLALRLSQVREIVRCDSAGTEIALRDRTIPALPVAVALGLDAPDPAFAVVTEGPQPVALRVDEVHGIADLGEAEIFQLPARTVLPQPPPFVGAVVRGGEIALELAVATLGWAPLEPAPEASAMPSDLDFSAERELVFSRGGRAYAIQLPLLAHVLDAPAIFAVPLAPPAHRGILYHGRAIHPVFDVALIYGGVAPAHVRPSSGTAGETVRTCERPGLPTALLVEAGGNTVAVLADRILASSEPVPDDVVRPSWDLLFGAA